MGEKASTVETVISVVVLVAVATQTWILVQDATQGDAGRHLRRWWERRARPQVVRAVTWLDAHDQVERMYTEEIVPMLWEVS